MQPSDTLKENCLLKIADIYTTESVNEELKEITGFRDEKSGIAKRILLHVSDGKVKCQK